MTYSDSAQTHLFVELLSFPGSYALLSEASDVNHAVVFVHGFLGDSFETWVDFQRLCDQLPGWSQADLFFLSYDSFWSSVAQSAERVSRFLDEIAEPDPEWLDLSSRLPPGIQVPSDEEPFCRLTRARYEHLTLVGHSLGGLVLRKVVLEEAKTAATTAPRGSRNRRQASPNAVLIGDAMGQTSERIGDRVSVLDARLVLFAPALFGARVAGIGGLLLRVGGLRMLAAALLGLSKSYQEIQKDSPLITYIREKTEVAADAQPNKRGFRATVLWPDSDSILVDNEYSCDRKVERAPRKNHVSVCKPSMQYRTPVDLVLDDL